MERRVAIHASIAAKLADHARSRAEVERGDGFTAIAADLDAAADHLSEAAESGEGGQFVSVKLTKLGAVVAHSSFAFRQSNEGVLDTARTMLREQTPYWNE